MAMRKTRAVTESKMLSHLRLTNQLLTMCAIGSLPLRSLTSDIKQLVCQLANLEVGLAIRQLASMGRPYELT